MRSGMAVRWIWRWIRGIKEERWGLVEGFVGVPVKEFGRASGFKRYCER